MLHAASAQTATASSDAVEVVATPPTDVTAQAAEAAAALLALSNTLPIDDAIPPKDLAAAKVTNRVPLKALQIAACEHSRGESGAVSALRRGGGELVDRVRAGDAARGGQCHGARAADHEEHLEAALHERRPDARALRDAFKSVSSLPASETTRGQVKQLTKLLTTTKKPRAEKVTQKELGVVAKGMKKAKVAGVKAAKAAVANAAAAEALRAPRGSSPAPTAAPQGAAPAAPPVPAAPAVSDAPRSWSPPRRRPRSPSPGLRDRIGLHRGGTGTPRAPLRQRRSGVRASADSSEASSTAPARGWRRLHSEEIIMNAHTPKQPTLSLVTPRGQAPSRPTPITRAHARLSRQLRAAVSQYVRPCDVDDLVQDTWVVASRMPAKLTASGRHGARGSSGSPSGARRRTSLTRRWWRSRSTRCSPPGQAGDDDEGEVDGPKRRAPRTRRKRREGRRGEEQVRGEIRPKRERAPPRAEGYARGTRERGAAMRLELALLSILLASCATTGDEGAGDLSARSFQPPARRSRSTVRSR